MTEKLAEWLVNFIATYPNSVGVFLVVYVVSSATVHGLRLAYPVEAERPRLVNFLIGFLDIGALNFWRPISAIKSATGNGGGK